MCVEEPYRKFCQVSHLFTIMIFLFSVYKCVSLCVCFFQCLPQGANLLGMGGRGQSSRFPDKGWPWEAFQRAPAGVHPPTLPALKTHNNNNNTLIFKYHHHMLPSKNTHTHTSAYSAHYQHWKHTTRTLLYLNNTITCSHKYVWLPSKHTHTHISAYCTHLHAVWSAVDRDL